MKKERFILTFICLFVGHLIYAQNPVIKDIGMSDPHVRIFNDTIYLYCGNDSGPRDKTWVMKNWRIFSSTDLVNWSFRNTISPEDNYMDDNSTDCWAGDAATRNGKYYFYFSDRKRGIGVMTSNLPTGHFTDALGKPLVSPMHDPTLLTDDDKNKTPYIVYGDKEGGGFHIARLNEDMISLAEEPKPIIITGEEWENAPGWMDKNYIFKNNEKYYLSWGRDYAVAENVYGPYTCVGAVGHGHHLNEFAHGSFFNWKGQFYHIWCYYLKPGYKYRESVITYCHFDDDGKIVTDTEFLDEHFSNGVGRYNASWDKIEAEWYYEISGDIMKKGSREDGFVISNIQQGNWIRFANVTFEKEYRKCIVNAKMTSGKGLLELRSGSPTGALLSEFELSSSDSFLTIENEISPTRGKKDLYLVLKSPETSSLQMDWIRFK